MRKIAPARELTLPHNVKSKALEVEAPFALCAKRARPGTIAPLAVVKPTYDAIHPGLRNVFVDNGQPAVAQHPPQLA